MIFSNCPRCGEAIRVPTDELPDDAFAHCPWCRETFPVSEVLKILPPVLEVLSADGTPFVPARHQAAALGIAGLSDTSAGPGLESISEQADAGFLIDQATESSELDGEGLNFESPSSAETVVDEDTSQSFEFGETALNDFVAGDPNNSWERDEIAPMRVSPTRPRKRKGGGIGTAIKVVLGGVLAVPIAGGLLTLWWGHPPDWGFWPFNGGGVEPGRNIVAAQPADLSSRSAQPSVTQNKPSGRMLNPDLGDEALSVADDPADLAREQIMAEPIVDDLSPNKEADPPQADSPIVLPTANELAVNEPNLTDQTESEDSAVSLETTLQAPGLEMPTATAGAANSESKQPAVESPLPDTAEAITAVQPAAAGDSAELVAMADRAGKMIEALSTYDGDPKERVRRMLLTYEKIAVACNMATSDSKALRRLASRIKNSSLLDEIGDAASEWLVYSSRNSEGIVLVGQASTNDQGQIIRLDSGTVLSVVGDLPLPTAERVLAMGRIIDENSVELVLTQPLP